MKPCRRKNPWIVFVRTVLLSSTFCLSAHAADISWINASGGNWSTPTNWDLGVVPGSLDHAIIDLAGTYTVTADIHPVVASLTLGGASGTQTLTKSGGTLTLGGSSSIGVNGALNLVSVTVNGTGTLTNNGNMSLRSCAINAPFENLGALVLSSTSNVNGSFTSGSGSTIHIQGTIAGAGVATFANGFTNNGAVELTSTSASQPAFLTVTNGTLVNSVGSTIDVLAGLGGPRQLTLQLDNQGTLNVGAALTMPRASSDHVNTGTIDVSGGNLTVSQAGTTPTFTNSGALTVASGRTCTVSGGGLIYNGGLGGSGALSLSGVTGTLNANLSNAATAIALATTTINGPGTLTNAVGKTLTLTTCTINAPFENSGDLVFLSTSNVNGSFTSGSGSTIHIQGSIAGAGVATFANGFTNNGAVELTSTSASQPAFLTVTNGTLVNSLGSTIDVLAGLGGPRQLTLQLDNQGTLNVGAALTMPRASSDHVNTGTIDVSGGNLTVSQAGTTPTFTNSGALTVASGRTCTVSGGGLIYNGGLGGSGTLSLSGVTGTLNANLSNAATEMAAANTTINGPGTLTNAVGKTLTLTTCTINAPFENLGDLLFLSTSNVNGSFTSGSGSTIHIQGSIAGAGVATIANGFTNNGAVELTSTSASQPAFLTVTNGTLVNSLGSTIDVLAGLGGPRQLTLQLDNQGTLNVGAALTMPRASSDHVNTGTIDVSGGNLTVTQSGTTPTFTNSGALTVASGRTCTVSGGTSTNSVGGFIRGSGTLNVLTSSFTNAGTISPGVSPGVFSVSGNCPFSASSALDIEIGGPMSGTDHDLLAISATATLSGSLNVSLVPGFCATPGDTFRVLTAGTRTGTFSSINVSGSGNPIFNAQYDATGLTLTTISNTLTVTASGGLGGSISPSGAIPVDCGDDQTFNIVADPCHHIVDVVVDGASVGPVSSYTFAGVSEDHTISVSFALNVYTITASAGPGGSVTPSGAVLVGCGADQGFTIAPSLGYAVADVLVDGQSVGPVTTYSFDDVSVDHTLAASFVDIAPPSVQVLVPNGGETWDALTVQVVRWTATDNASVDSVNVDYSLHGLVGPWLPIQHSVVGADSVSWAIPDVGTDSAMVRVTGFDPTGNQGEDVNDGLFEIRGPTDAPVLGVAPVLGLRLAPSVVRSGSVQMNIALPDAGEARVEVVSVTGRRIWEGHVVGATFGEYALHWNGRDSSGKSVTTGLYFVRLTSAWGNKTARLLFLE